MSLRSVVGACVGGAVSSFDCLDRCEGVTAGLDGQLEEDALVLWASLVKVIVVLTGVFLQVLCGSSPVGVCAAWLCFS